IRSKSLESLNVSTQTSAIQAPASVWLFASASCSAPVDASGLGLRPDKDPPSSSHFLPQRDERPVRGAGRAAAEKWILVVEDNFGDVDLIRHSLKEHHVQHEIVALSDGEQACQ